MVLLVLYLVLVLLWWWVWLRWALRPPAGPSAPQPARRATRAVPPARPPSRRRARGRELRGLPLTEDDVIAFGLALERTEDVVRSARAGPSRPPTEHGAHRDAPGPS